MLSPDENKAATCSSTIFDQHNLHFVQGTYNISNITDISNTEDIIESKNEMEEIKPEEEKYMLDKFILCTLRTQLGKTFICISRIDNELKLDNTYGNHPYRVNYISLGYIIFMNEKYKALSIS